MNRFSLPALLLTLLLCGCAGSILSHKPYSLQPGIVVDSTPKKGVVTIWPKEEWMWQGGGPSGPDYYQAIGDRVVNVCPETLPALGERFKRADLTWDKARKCWQWKSIH